MIISMTATRLSIIIPPLRIIFATLIILLVILNFTLMQIPLLAIYVLGVALIGTIIYSWQEGQIKGSDKIFYLLWGGAFIVNLLTQVSF